MESDNISIFVSFPLVSIILPYYGFTHRGFLLLSELSKETRQMLSKNYKIFRRIMFDYSIKKKISLYHICELPLPCDLFKFILDEYIIEESEYLITFANKLANNEGCHFNENNMNEQICLDWIVVHFEEIINIYPNVKLFESIKTTIYSESEHKYFSSSLFGHILLSSADFKDDDGSFKLCHFKDTDCKEINPFYQPFKKVWDIYASKENEQLLFSILRQKEIIEVQTLDLSTLDLDNFEEAIKPEYFECKIKNLRFYNEECFKLRNSTLENISKINLIELALFSIKSAPNIVRILSHIPNNMTVSFGLDSIDNFNFKFSDTIVYIKDNKDQIKIYCKDIYFHYLSFKKFDKVYIDKNNIYLQMPSNMRISHFTKENVAVNFESEEVSSTYFDINDIEILPKNRLSEVHLDFHNFQQLCLSDCIKNYFPILPSTCKFYIKMLSIYDMINFEKVSMYVPPHCELKMTDIYFSNSNMEGCDIENTFFKIVSKYNLRSLRIRVKSHSEIISMLSYPSIQLSLQNLTLQKCLYSDCASILSLCKEFRQLETIEFFQTYMIQQEYTDQIMKEKKEIAIRCWNIRKITITSDFC